MTTQTAAVNPYKKDQRIQTSGAGRTATWGRTFAGTVMHIMDRRDQKRVYVLWDGCRFEDEMFLSEVKPS